MTNVQTLRTLVAILECAPAAQAMTVFESAVRNDDLSLFWTQSALHQPSAMTSPCLAMPVGSASLSRGPLVRQRRLVDRPDAAIPLERRRRRALPAEPLLEVEHGAR